MIKWSIHQEEITILNMFGPNYRSSKHMKQKLKELRVEIEELTVIVGDLYTSQSRIARLLN